MANLDQEQLKNLLARAANPSLDSKALAEEKKDTKVAEGLGQMLGGGFGTGKKNESNIYIFMIDYSLSFYVYYSSIFDLDFNLACTLISNLFQIQLFNWMILLFL